MIHCKQFQVVQAFFGPLGFFQVQESPSLARQTENQTCTSGTWFCINWSENRCIIRLQSIYPAVLLRRQGSSISGTRKVTSTGCLHLSSQILIFTLFANFHKLSNQPAKLSNTASCTVGKNCEIYLILANSAVFVNFGVKIQTLINSDI